VKNFNAIILHNVPGDIHRYHSSDSIEGDAEGSNEAVLADPEFLNSLEEPGIPPHELNLKIGAICRLTRNFDASRGLTKNTRVIVRNLLRYTVEIETISAVVAGKMVDPVHQLLPTNSPAECCVRSDCTFHELISIFNLRHSILPSTENRYPSLCAMPLPSMAVRA
jgi:hypothetical protein